ncbi:MAG: aquaporin [Gaiellaceae bacterium]|jgi:MIP family channel proteins|nr:aquaporin [Gaiellaceae bacterium]MDX6436245.1 aquaporin [Gaiellaceae bacterium]
MDHDPFRRSFAEFVGTFALIFVGAGTTLSLAKTLAPALRDAPSVNVYGGLTLVAVALANGLVIAVMASAVGHISGGHFNPAVTLGFFITRRIAPSLAVAYWSMQITGAVAAAALLRWLYPAATRDLTNLGSPGLSGGVSVWQGLVIEAVLTFFLVWVIFATAADPGGAFKSIAGLAIGLTVTLDVLMGGPMTGAAMNPARAFGPQLLSRHWTDAWVWYVGPFVGGALAAVVYEYLYLRPPPIPVGPPDTGVIEPRPGDAAVS